MEELKSNAEIRSEAAAWVEKSGAILDADVSRRQAVLSRFLEPWTLAVTVGELMAVGCRFRSIAPNPSPRLRCLQVVHFQNLVDWPPPGFLALSVRPNNIFDPPPRSAMMDILTRHLDRSASVGDVLKIDGGWAVAVSEAGEIPRSMAGFSVAVMEPVEIEKLSPGTSTGKKKITVASPRIDAVSAKVLKPSREQVKKHLETGGVLLNYRPASKPGTELGPGDVVAVRGGGTFRFEKIVGESKKGRVYAEVEVLSGP